MLSRNRLKFMISLQKKKVRDEEGLFLIEGDKIVREFLAARFPLKILAAKPEFLKSLPQDSFRQGMDVEEVSYDELKQISTLKTPHNALGVAVIPQKDINLNEIFRELSVALDCIQDPGNLGTIVRAAGWFGIRSIICSPDSVDVYNPRVVQASMGALLHVSVYYADLKKVLELAGEENVPVFGTALGGSSVYEHQLGSTGIILMGNESRGISTDIEPFITEKLLIPRFSIAAPGIDSLNVGMAASIVFSEFRRRSF